jgi:hypothetical protein
MKKEFNPSKSLLRQLSKRQIAYHPVYRKITGSTTAGIMLSQIMYWWDKMDGREFYKTDADFIEETAMTQDEIRGAKTRLKGLEFVKITRKGIPAKTFYWVNADKLIEVIAYTEEGKIPNQVSGNSPNCNEEIPQTNTIDYSIDYSIKEDKIEKPLLSPGEKTPTLNNKKKERRQDAERCASDTPAPSPIPDTPEQRLIIAQAMIEHAKGEGEAQWKFMCNSQGYTGTPDAILSIWASKATPHQLTNWRKEFNKLHYWLRNEARAQKAGAVGVIQDDIKFV